VSAPAPGIREVFGSSVATYSWYDDRVPSSSVAAIDRLVAFLEQQPAPFDAVIGFSLGAAVISTLLLRTDEGAARAKAQVRSAVFLSAILPVDWARLVADGRKCYAGEAGTTIVPISVPTVLAWSDNDTAYPGMSAKLVPMCTAEGRVEIKHSAGHGIPSKGPEMEAIADAIRALVEKVHVEA
jgi:hypothetical protein